MRHFFKADGSRWTSVDDATFEMGLVNVLGDDWAHAIEVETIPSHGRDTLNPQTLAIIPYVEPTDFNEIAKQLEGAFIQLIPNHQGESYLTGSVKALVWGAKTAVTDAVRSGALVDARDIIESLTLPTEMQADQQTLISQLNSLIGD
jgi:hypothetical protein